MTEGLRKISKSYPLAKTTVEESGEHVVMGTGARVPRAKRPSRIEPVTTLRSPRVERDDDNTSRSSRCERARPTFDVAQRARSSSPASS